MGYKGLMHSQSLFYFWILFLYWFIGIRKSSVKRRLSGDDENLFAVVLIAFRFDLCLVVEAQHDDVTSKQGTNVIAIVAGKDKTTLTVFPSVDVVVKTETDMYTLPKQSEVFEFETDARNTLSFESMYITISRNMTATKPVSITCGSNGIYRHIQHCTISTLFMETNGSVCLQCRSHTSRAVIFSPSTFERVS